MPTATALDPERRGLAADKLHATLTSAIIGQSDPIEKFVDAIQMWRVGLGPIGRPVSSFLLLGPTGTGKTHSVEQLAKAVHGDSKCLLRIDCAEYQHGHEIAKLLGSPPGYLGHRETTPMLSQAAITAVAGAAELGIILFDEIEKASDVLWNLLLGILDRAQCTTGDNAKVNFSKCMIFMTSNLGAREIERAGSPAYGFSSEKDPSEIASAIISGAEGAVKRRFTPEFRNRIDRTCIYKPLDHEALEAVMELELAAIQSRIYLTANKSTPSFQLIVNKPTRESLLKEGTDLKFGARFLKRTLEKRLVYPIANMIASDQIPYGSDVIADGPAEAVTFSLEKHLIPHDNF